MTPKSICCSLETAKKLKEAGWDKDTVFVWEECPAVEGYILCSHDEDTGHHTNYYPAPTSAEIELPVGFVVGQHERYVFYCGQSHHFKFGDEYGNTEVEAKAEMWLYLKGKGLL